MKKIIAFAGSNSKNSINQRLIEAISKLIGQHEVEVINLANYAAPVYGIDHEIEYGVPDSIKDLFSVFNTSDAFIVAIPEHNGSMPAVLKNTIDWLSRVESGVKVFREKPVVFVSTSPGPRGAQSALSHVVEIMPYRGAHVVGSLSFGSFDSHFVDGVMTAESELLIRPILDKLEDSLA